MSNYCNCSSLHNNILSVFRLVLVLWSLLREELSFLYFSFLRHRPITYYKRSLEVSCFSVFSMLTQCTKKFNFFMFSCFSVLVFFYNIKNPLKHETTKLSV